METIALKDWDSWAKHATKYVFFLIYTLNIFELFFWSCRLLNHSPYMALTAKLHQENHLVELGDSISGFVEVFLLCDQWCTCGNLWCKYAGPLYLGSSHTSLKPWKWSEACTKEQATYMTEFGQNSGLNQICHDTIVFSTTIVSEVVFLVPLWGKGKRSWNGRGWCTTRGHRIGHVSFEKKTRCKTADTLHCDKRFLKIAFAHQFQIKGNAGRVDQSICDPKKLTQKMQPAS